MKAHIELLGWINIVSGTFAILIALAVAVLLFTLAPIVPDRQAAIILPIVAVIIGGLIPTFAIFNVITGIGLLQSKRWARTLALVLGVIALFSFPIGTLVGIYTFWVLTKPEASQLFGAAM